MIRIMFVIGFEQTKKRGAHLNKKMKNRKKPKTGKEGDLNMR